MSIGAVFASPFKENQCRRRAEGRRAPDPPRALPGTAICCQRANLEQNSIVVSLPVPPGGEGAFAAGSAKPMPMFALRGSTALGVIRLPLAILLLTLTWPLAALAAPFQTKAPTALLIDDNSGATLFEKNADRSVAPASTTKILTAEIVLREIAEGRLHLGDRLPISPKAAREGDAESGGSSMFAQANTQVSIDDLLRGLLITSGNDAAVALAEGIAGSETAFAARMN